MSEKKRRELWFDVLCLALLALAVAAFFWPLFLEGKWIPRGGGDLVSFIWPMYRFAARSLRRGVIPLWNPHLYSGAPFVADNQSGVFYPINLLTFALVGEPTYPVIEGLVLFHIWLAGANMFALLRGLRLRRSAALLGGLAFALSDLFVTHIGNLNLNATAAWFPLLLMMTHRALAGDSVEWAAGAGAVLAVAALVGHAQMLLFLALLILLYTLYRLAVDWRRAARTLGLTALIAAVGIGGAALMLLPAYEMAGHTGRGHLPYDEATRYSLPPRALIGLLAPDFYGRGPAGFWGSWDRVEVGYAGVPTLVLATFALALYILHFTPYVSHFTQNPPFPTAFFAFLIPLAFFLAMGRYTPLYGLLYRIAPTFDQVRVPARLIVLADLGLAALAGYGLDRLLSSEFQASSVWIGLGVLSAAALLLAVGLPQARSVPPPDRIPQATRGIIIAAVLLALSGLLVGIARRWRWAGWLFPLLLAVDLIGLGSTVEIESHNPTLGFRHKDVVAFLRQDPALFRIDSQASGAWQPDAALVHGLYDIGGIFNPLGLAPYQAYRWAIGEPGAPLYNLLGVKYILAESGKPPGDERLTPVYTANPEIDIYLNTSALPRALLVYCPQVVDDHGAAWQAIHEPTFDPTKTVILEKDVPDVACKEPVDGRHISFVRYGLNEVELTVTTPVSGVLVLSDVYYPGWRATVDGTSTEVLRTDYTFRGISLPPGEHLVNMTFAPWTWHVGLALSLCTWVGLGFWTAWKLGPGSVQWKRLNGQPGFGGNIRKHSTSGD